MSVIQRQTNYRYYRQSKFLFVADPTLRETRKMNFRKTVLTFFITLPFITQFLFSQTASQGIDEKLNDSIIPFALAW
jgi:hypothetical protein